MPSEDFAAEFKLTALIPRDLFNINYTSFKSSRGLPTCSIFRRICITCLPSIDDDDVTRRYLMLLYKEWRRKLLESQEIQMYRRKASNTLRRRNGACRKYFLLSKLKEVYLILNIKRQNQLVYPCTSGP